MIATNKFVDYMQKLQLHLYNKILVVQVIYKSWAKKLWKPCFYYFMEDKVIKA